MQVSRQANTSVGVLLALCFGISLGHAQTPTATVEGSIANNGIHSAVGLERVPSMPLDQVQGYSGEVHDDGSFIFRDIPPGSYRLIADSETELHAIYGADNLGQPGTILQVRAGDHLRGLSLHLLPDPPAICGRVVDAAGKPVMVTVEAYSVNLGDGQRAGLQQPTQLTGPDGTFRFPHLFQQGHFFLRANGTWYPSSTSFGGARELEPRRVASGLSCVEIRPQPQRCKGYGVDGTIDGTLKNPVSQYEASLLEVNPSGSLFDAQVVNLTRAEQVHFDDVCPGKYIIFIRDAWLGHQQFFVTPVFTAQEPATAVHLTETDTNDLSKIVAAGNSKLASADVTMTFEGLTPEQAAQTHVLQSVSMQRAGDVYVHAAPDTHGLFHFTALRPGEYRLIAGTGEDGVAYLKSFIVDGQTADPKHIILDDGQAAKFDLVFSNDPAGQFKAVALEPLAPPHYLPARFYPSASLSGKVMGPIDLAATVLLRSARFNSARSSFYREPMAPDGSFSFKSVDPGIYTLAVEGKGLPASAFGARHAGFVGEPITLTAGQKMSGIQLPVLPIASICGRVVDLEGNPLAAAGVGIHAYPISGGAALDKYVLTDEQGRFDFQTPASRPNVELSAQEGPSRAFYPWRANYRGGDGKDLQAITTDCPYVLQMPSPAEGNVAAGYHISGTIKDPGNLRIKSEPANPSFAKGEHLVVTLTPVSDRLAPVGQTFEVVHDAFNLVQDSFDFTKVVPGRYTLSLVENMGNAAMVCSMVCPGDTTYLRDSVPVTVGRSDVTDLTLEVRPLPTVTGEILIDGKQPNPAQKTLWGSWFADLVSASGGERAEMAQLDADGHFAFKTVGASHYEFLLNNFRADYFVQAIELNGKPANVRDLSFELGESAHLVVEISSHLAHGTISSAAPDPPVDLYPNRQQYGGSWIVYVIPEPLPLHNPDVIQSAGQQIGNRVVASLYDVPPGHYRILAAENTGLHAPNFFPSYRVDQRLLSDPGFLSRLASLGKSVEITAGQPFNLEAPLVTAQVQRLLSELEIPASLSTPE
jgi:hypothetical protein